MAPFIQRLASASGFACAVVLLGLALPAHSARIAEWNFDDGTANDSVGAFDLSLVGGGPTISKVFTPNVMGSGSVSTITFTITLTCT